MCSSPTPPTSDQNTTSSVTDLPSSEFNSDSTNSINSGISCPSSDSESANNPPMLPDDSSEPENDLDYSIYEYEGPWDDRDDAGAPTGPEAEVQGPNQSIPCELPIPGPSNPSTGNLEDDTTLPTAFCENCAVCLLYLQTVIANIFDSRTILASNTQLSNGFDLLQATGLILEQSIKSPKTLSTAKRRLGLDYNKYIKKIPICNKCYKNYTYEDIKRLLSPSCTVKQCKGKVYQVKWTASIEGDETDLVEKRDPMKILPYISLIKGLQ